MTTRKEALATLAEIEHKLLESDAKLDGLQRRIGAYRAAQEENQAEQEQPPAAALADPIEAEYNRQERGLHQQLADLETQRAAYDSAIGRGVGLDEQLYEAEFGRQQRNLRAELERLEQQRNQYRRTRAADVQVAATGYEQERMAAVEDQQARQAAFMDEQRRQSEAHDAYEAEQQRLYEQWLAGQAAAGNL